MVKSFQNEKHHKKREIKIIRVDPIEKMLIPVMNEELPKDITNLTNTISNFLNSQKQLNEELKIIKPESNINSFDNIKNYNLIKNEEDNLYREIFFTKKIFENDFENDNEEIYYSPINENTEFDELLNDLNEIFYKYLEIMKKFKENFKDGFNLFNPKNKTYLIMDKKKKDLITNLVKWKGTKNISEALSLSNKSLKRWIVKGTQRKNGGGRKVLDPEMESKLLIWIENQKKLGIKLNGTSIKKKAKMLSKFKSFLASKGWFEKFKKKNHISLKFQK